MKNKVKKMLLLLIIIRHTILMIIYIIGWRREKEKDLSMRLLRALKSIVLDSGDMPSSHEPLPSSVKRETQELMG